MNYALIFFGPILGIGIIIRIITGDFPTGIPLIAIWSASLIALFVYGYRRLYSSSGEPASDSEDSTE